jgi:hypothetical protein
MNKRPTIGGVANLAGWAAAAVGLAAISSWALVVSVHVADGYRVDHVTGAWMALAQAADAGELYPPLHEDGRFGGTRYMPLALVAYTGVAQLTGEYVVSGKLLAATTLMLILALVWSTARWLGADRRLALACAGATIAPFPGFFAGTTMYGDALPVLLQLAAVAIVLRRGGRRWAAAAGILAALAITAKVSAVWGGTAVLLCLLLRDRRSIPVFVLSSAATGSSVLALVEVVSGGRFSENIRTLASSGFSGTNALLIDTPQKLVELLAVRADGTLLLLPFAVVLLVVAAVRRRLDAVTLTLVPALAVTIVVLNDAGTDFNHLLDLAVLTPLVIVAGHAHWRSGALSVVVSLALAAGTTLSLWELRHDVREAAAALVSREVPARYHLPRLPEHVSGSLFSEDPGVAVDNGRRPVVLDAFMLLRLLNERPDWKRELIERFERHEFDTVVLIQDLERARTWWSTSHLGTDVARTISRNYVLQRRLPGPVFSYHIYVPRVRGASG